MAMNKECYITNTNKNESIVNLSAADCEDIQKDQQIDFEEYKYMSH